MPRVLHLTTISFSLEALLGSQLRSMVAAGWEVVTASAPGPEIAALEHDGIRHVGLDHATRSWSLSKDLLLGRELHRLVRAVRPDIVHTHNPKPGVIGRPVAQLIKGVKVVNTVHGLYAQPKDPIKRRLPVYAAERIAAVFSDAELFQNSDDMDMMRQLRVPESKLHYLGNGVDLSIFRPIPSQRTAARAAMGIEDDDAIVIGCVARLVREKGIPELVEVFGKVRESNPRARLVLIGWEDESRHDAYRLPSVEDLSYRGISALGFRDDVEFLYQGMDIFALLSHREGFPRSVMEASACGVPVIATDIRGCTSAVFDDRNGYLVPLEDPASAAARILQIAQDAVLRERLGLGAVEVARQHFDVQTQVDITLRVYESLLGH